MGKYPVLSVTAGAEEVLAGHKEVEEIRQEVIVPSRKTKKSASISLAPKYPVLVLVGYLNIYGNIANNWHRNLVCRRILYSLTRCLSI